MLLPAIKSRARTRTLVTAFGGYHHGPGCADGEFCEETNLSARDWPALSPRKPRRKLAQIAAPHGLFAKNGLLWVDGTTLCYLPGGSGAEEEALFQMENALTDTDKIFCGMGTKVLIFPDKVSFDTAARTLEPLEASWSTPTLGIAGLDGVSFQVCDADGVTYQPDGSGTLEPEDPDDGYIFLKQRAGSASAMASSSTLLVYNASAGQWVTAELGYCRIGGLGIGAAFRQWDTVTLEGVSETIRSRLSRELEGDKIIYAKDDDWIVVSAAPETRTRDYYGIFRQTENEVRWDTSLAGGTSNWLSNSDGGLITATRRVPDLDYMTECSNRVWGCSSAENVIYACKLGDPTNWFSYRGTAADSYAVTVGSDGPFTGAASCLGYVLFFKENTLHKLYGARPADYQLTAITCRGVQPGSAKSLCVLNETLYYKADDGVMVYDGSLPVRISAPLGDVRYGGAVGGAALKGYYVSMQDEAGGSHLFCYDEARGLWHREDAVQALDFARVGQDLFFVAADGGLWVVDGSTAYRAGTGTAETTVAWSAETGDLGLTEKDYQYLARLTLRMEAQEAAAVKVEVQYDSGTWETVCERSFAGRTPVRLPFVPRRFDHLRLRISGTGAVRLYTLERAVEGGSELNMPG